MSDCRLLPDRRSLVLAVLGHLILHLPTIAQGQRIDAWTGLVHERTIDSLTHSVQADAPWDFIVGLLETPEEYDEFSLNATSEIPSTPIIDWAHEVMLYSIWPDNTNDVAFESWEPPTTGTGRINIGWDGIEILYPQSFPALVHTVSRIGLAQVEFVLASGPPPGLPPVVLGRLAVSNQRSIGDFDGDGLQTATDIDALTAAVHLASSDTRFDLNQDGNVDLTDHRVWVKDLRNTWFGDANLDGEFNSGDLIDVFRAGKYGLPTEAGWAEGDWTGNRRFDSGDLLAAFQDGGYRLGPASAARAVPEPSCAISLSIGIIFLFFRTWRHTQWNSVRTG